MTKPFEYEELVARMEAVIRRGPIIRGGQLASREEGLIIREIQIVDELIVPFFQPVFFLTRFNCMDSRPWGVRRQTVYFFSNPEVLFKLALQFGFYQEMEVISWKKAVASAGKFLEDKKLFLNCNPYLVEGQKFPNH